MCAWAVLMDRPFLFLGGGAEDRGRLSQQAMIRVRRQLFNGDLFRADEVGVSRGGGTGEKGGEGISCPCLALHRWNVFNQLANHRASD